MSSRKEEERNEKIIRGLMKLPPNRRCINCNSLGPQYVCTNFWTFICTACSGVHREFTHRVKSVSMAKFTTKEVEALQKGGNQCARDIFLSDWDFQRSRLPDSSKPDRIREFIKSVYVDKKYAGGRSSDKPPRDVQSNKNFEEDPRRASSYHSYSQSPPYDHQYEDRRYGKLAGTLSRKPGSDRGLYEGKMSSFICSPGRLGEQMYEDRFANEISGPRISDYSVSSAGDTLRFGGQSPNFQSESGYGSPNQPVRDILIEDGRHRISSSCSEANAGSSADTIPHSKRTASTGSFGSFDSNSMSLKSVNSGSLHDIVIETEQSTESQSVEVSFSSGPPSSASTLPSNMDLFHPPVVPSASSVDLFAEVNQSSTASSLIGKSLPPGNHDLFGQPFVQQAATSSIGSLDLFAEINPHSSMASLDKPLSVPITKKEGWATFDLPHTGSASETKTTPYCTVVPPDGIDKGGFDAFPLKSNNPSWPSTQSSASHESFAVGDNQWDSASNEVKVSSGPSFSQTWNAFDDSFGNFPLTPFGNTLLKNKVKVPGHDPPASVDPCVNLKVEEHSDKDDLQTSTVDVRSTGINLSFNSSVTGSSFTPVIPPMVCNLLGLIRWFI
uniref:Putative ADP-ribosylation factor GTPase-activating protein AGD14 n=1 Tax=Anthurium amnicola TaxID=1678845 RepID=A0A1D1YB53_9ARAE